MKSSGSLKVKTETMEPELKVKSEELLHQSNPLQNKVQSSPYSSTDGAQLVRPDPPDCDKSLEGPLALIKNESADCRKSTDDSHHPHAIAIPQVGSSFHHSAITSPAFGRFVQTMDGHLYPMIAAKAEDVMPKIKGEVETSSYNHREKHLGSPGFEFQTTSNTARKRPRPKSEEGFSGIPGDDIKTNPMKQEEKSLTVWDGLKAHKRENPNSKRRKFSRTSRAYASNRQALLHVVNLVKACLTLCKQDRRPQEDIASNIKSIRRRLHQMRFYDFLNDTLLVETNITGANKLGLIILNATGIFPADVQEYAEELKRRWDKGSYDPSLFSGITKVVRSTESRRSFTHRVIDIEASQRIDSLYVGQGDLVQGQWWPKVICAVRDSSHGELQAGIHGDKSLGALSIVLANGGYDDIDEGETIKVNFLRRACC